MYSTKLKNKNNKKNAVIVAILLLLFVATLLIILEKTGVTNFYTKKPTQSVGTSTENTINLGPPTEEEKNAGDEKKAEVLEQDNQEDATPTSDNVSVVIVDANQYEEVVEVRAFVANTLKDGTCTYIFKKDNNTIEKTTPAYADASSTPCITLTVNRSEFISPGTWNLTVNYTSQNLQGSESTTLEIK